MSIYPGRTVLVIRRRRKLSELNWGPFAVGAVFTAAAPSLVIVMYGYWGVGTWTGLIVGGILAVFLGISAVGALLKRTSL